MTATSPEALASNDAPVRGPGLPALAVRGARDLRDRHRLIRYLVASELKRTHADTVFGQLWWLFDPLLQMAIYVVLVTVIFKRSTPDYPLFLFAAILPWKWFSTGLNEATLSVTGRQGLIRQVQFPKLVLPAAAVTAGTLSFIVGLAALALVYVFYLHRLSAWVLLIPVIAVVQYVLTLALGIALAAMNAFYRDVANILRHVTRLWFYLSPILYSVDQHTSPGSAARTWLQLNPMTPLLESYRAVTWGTSAPDWLGLLWVLVFALVLLALTIALFKRVEPAFARIL